MGNELMLDVGQAEKLKLAFRRHKWTNAKIDRLCEGGTLGEVLLVIDGHAEIKLLQHIIDLDARPLCPNGLTVKEHQKGGTFLWEPAKVQLYLSKSQSKGKVIGGSDLRKDLAGKPVLNACLLDYLLKHPHLIPEEWKGKLIFFWGTIYHNSNGDLCVRYLCWSVGRWRSISFWLVGGWGDGCPAALRAE